MIHGICKLLCLRGLLTKLGFPIEGPMSLYCDDKAAISIAHNSIQYDRTKNMEVDCHFIKDHQKSENIRTLFVRKDDQLTNILTKGLFNAQLFPFFNKLGMWVLYALT